MRAQPADFFALLAIKSSCTCEDRARIKSPVMLWFSVQRAPHCMDVSLHCPIYFLFDTSSLNYDLVCMLAQAVFPSMYAVIAESMVSLFLWTIAWPGMTSAVSSESPGQEFKLGSQGRRAPHHQMGPSNEGVEDHETNFVWVPFVHFTCSAHAPSRACCEKNSNVCGRLFGWESLVSMSPLFHFI